MSTAKHTPGPWKARDHLLMPGTMVAIVDALGLDVVHICAAGADGKYDARVSNANASLVAAAPSLLFAARRALALFEDMTRGLPGEYEEVALLRAAIAKAEGGP